MFCLWKTVINSCAEWRSLSSTDWTDIKSADFFLFCLLHHKRSPLQEWDCKAAQSPVHGICPVQGLCPISWCAHRILTFICNVILHWEVFHQEWGNDTFLQALFCTPNLVCVCLCGSKIRNINTFANEPKPPACFQVSQHSAFLMTRIVLTCARVRAEWEGFLLYYWFPEPLLSHWFGRFNSWCVNAGEALWDRVSVTSKPKIYILLNVSFFSEISSKWALTRGTRNGLSWTNWFLMHEKFKLNILWEA